LQFIDSVYIPTASTSCELIYERLLKLSSDCAALIYEARAQQPGQPPYRALITSIYRQEGDRWVMVIHRQTPILA
jgi:hypothetical protein